MNKKKIIIAATLVGLMGSAVAAEASSFFQKVSGFVRSDIKVIVDGEKTSMKPVFINGQAYLPAKSEANALGYDVKYNPRDRSLTLTSRDQGNDGGNGGEEAQLMMLSGVVRSVSRLDNGAYRLDVVGRGQNSWVLLTVDKDTKLTNASGKNVNVKDLKAGTEIVAEYGPVMTMSFPGQSHAVKVTVGSQRLVKEDVITGVKHTDDGWQVTIGQAKHGAGLSQVVLNAGKETKLMNAQGSSIEWESLKPGTKVVAYYGPEMTKSLPPISPLHYLVALTDKPAQDTLSPAQVTEFQKLAWSKLPEGQASHVTTKRDEASVELVNASESGVLATTDEAKKLLQAAKDKGGKLVTVTYQTDQDQLLGPLTVVFDLESKTFIGYNVRR
ncbi:stalk domain-containing protein [Paenibacillus sp. GCM10023250]|uniref:stalk domain-containing protein n=1 Tax=Paenibacillus sp. GCM10023250 TaxID=3252648 RepID=UPI00361B9984